MYKMYFLGPVFFFIAIFLILAEERGLPITPVFPTLGLSSREGGSWESSEENEIHIHVQEEEK